MSADGTQRASIVAREADEKIFDFRLGRGAERATRGSQRIRSDESAAHHDVLSMSWCVVRDEPLVMIVPSTIERQSMASLLTAHPFIRMDRNAWTGQLVNQFLNDQRIAVRELFELDAPETIVILVAEGVGVSLLPDWGITPPVGREIRVDPIEDRKYARAVGVIGSRGPAAALIDVFTSTVEATARA